MQDCSNSIANALELLQSCAKPSDIIMWKTGFNCVTDTFSCEALCIQFSISHNKWLLNFPFKYAWHIFVLGTSGGAVTWLRIVQGLAFRLLSWLTWAFIRLTGWDLNKMATICRQDFEMHFAEMKIFVFSLKFHGNLFFRVQPIISQHWLR